MSDGVQAVEAAKGTELFAQRKVSGWANGEACGGPARVRFVQGSWVES